MTNYGIPELFILFVIIIIPLAALIYSLVELARDSSQNGTTKAIWVLVILAVPIIGPVVYLIIGKNKGSG